jgi:hypothetical protein
MSDALEATLTEELAPDLVKATPFRWLINFWFRPKKTLEEILSHEKAIWLIPLLVLSILQVIKSLVEGPIRSAALLTAQSTVDPAMQGYFSPDQMEQVQQSASFSSGPVFTIVFPAVVAIIGLWLGWIILGSLLHLVLTLAGNRNSAVSSLNLAAWASLPFAVRLILQIVVTLITKQLIVYPGLAGIWTSSSGFTGYLTVLRSFLDIYLIWQIVMLIIGARIMGNISKVKATISVLICVVVVIALQAVPSAIIQAFSGMSVTRPFFF